MNNKNRVKILSAEDWSKCFTHISHLVFPVGGIQAVYKEFTHYENYDSLPWESLGFSSEISKINKQTNKQKKTYHLIVALKNSGIK